MREPDQENLEVLKQVMRVGIDVRISPHAVITRPELVTLGNHVSIDPFVVITTALEVGDYVHIAPHCSIIGGALSKLVMKDFSGLSAGCRIVCGSDDYDGEGMINPFIPVKYRSPTNTVVVMEKYTTLATNVVVHPGVTIGEGTVVGSNSLVTMDLHPWTIYTGTPLRRIRERRRDKILEYARLLQKDTE